MSKLDKSTIAWKKKRFDEVAVIANGQVDPRIEPYCREIHIGPENIESHTGRIINLQKAEELGLISGKYVFDENSIIYSKIRPNLNKLCQPSFRGICSADMYPIWAKEEINKSYLYYFMQSPAFYNQAIKSSMRTGIPKINRQDLNRIKITYPVDHAVQNRIVNTISVWDNAIEKTEALISAKEKQFEWLTSNLINRAGHKRTAASGLMIEVSKRNKNSTIERVLSVTNHSGFVLPEEQFERRVASANVSNYKVVEQGQYAYNPSRINVGSIARLDDWENGILSPMYVVFKLDTKKVCSDYFLHWLNSSEARQRIKNSAQGSVRETVSFKDLGAIDIPLPAMDVQKDVTYKLNLAQKEIRLLKKTLEQYRSQKRGLMQKLLTGEWQVGSSQHLSEETCQELSREGVA
ncbi:TPA: restriction endonuclease subunit S [Vibrio parahaemolyticus]|uniref:Type I restriction modification DNA specificity domain-containing protein n=1 Tax=Litoribacillus peritrichatus TaxID=718191 RepID=A0ABP7NCP0_9GAMM|nr:restriction endonuclease subunit S [Vibrio parahaemolyticus]